LLIRQAQRLHIICDSDQISPVTRLFGTDKKPGYYADHRQNQNQDNPQCFLAGTHRALNGTHNGPHAYYQPDKTQKTGDFNRHVQSSELDGQNIMLAGYKNATVICGPGKKIGVIIGRELYRSATLH